MVSEVPLPATVQPPMQVRAIRLNTTCRSAKDPSFLLIGNRIAVLHLIFGAVTNITAVIGAAGRPSLIVPTKYGVMGCAMGPMTADTGYNGPVAGQYAGADHGTDIHTGHRRNEAVGGAVKIIVGVFAAQTGQIKIGWMPDPEGADPNNGCHRIGAAVKIAMTLAAQRTYR